MDFQSFESVNSHYDDGGVVYTSGPRKLSPDEETSCIRCGHDAEKAHALGWPAPTMPKPGYIHCPICSPGEVYRAADHNPTYREERARISMEIRDVFFEETQRGIKGGSSSSNGRSKDRKPGDKLIIRAEQGWHGFAPTHDSRTTIIKIQNSDQELNVRIPCYLKDELKNAANHRRVPISIVFKEAVADTLPSLGPNVSRVERGTKRTLLHQMVTAGERAALERECELRKSKMSDLVSEVLTIYFYRNP